MVTKDCILGKAWEAQLAMLVTGKTCWARFVKKWLFKNQPHEVACFFAFDSTIVGNGASACSGLCIPSEDCLIAIRNGS